MSPAVKTFPLILLAAGRSSRMGFPKGLLPVGGRPWLIEQLRRFQEAGGQRAIIVLGFHQEDYAQVIPWTSEAVRETVRMEDLEINVVVNPDPGRGQFSSLQCAAAFWAKGGKVAGESVIQSDGARESGDVPVPEVQGVFILPVDVPCPGKEVWEGLAGAFHPPLAAVIPRHRNRGGHPVLLSAAFLTRLGGIRSSEADARLDRQIRALPPEKVFYLDVEDPRIILNMNTPEEFRRLAREK